MIHGRCGTEPVDVKHPRGATQAMFHVEQMPYRV